MRLICITAVLVSLLMANLAFGAATVFFKDGTKEVGNSAWLDGNAVFLSKSKEIYEFSAEEVLLEETQKFNKIGKYADMALPDPRDGFAAPGSNDLVEQLMAGSNFDRQIDHFVQMFSAGAMSAAGSNSEIGDLFAQALAGFDPKKAKQKIRAYYRSHLDTRTLETIVAWTKSPLGKRVREAEASMSELSPEQIQQLLNSLEENPPPPARLALIQDLDKAGKATEMSLQLISDVIAGAMSAFPAGASDKKQARKEIESQMSRQKAQMEPLLRKQVQSALINTYKDLSDSEIRELVTFLRTEPSRKFTKATMGALSEMTKNLSASIVKSIVKAAEQRGASAR